MVSGSYNELVVLRNTYPIPKATVATALCGNMRCKMSKSGFDLSDSNLIHSALLTHYKTPRSIFSGFLPFQRSLVQHDKLSILAQLPVE